MKKIILWILFFCVVVQFTQGGNLKYYSSEKLASSLISTLYQDSEGYIWVGTEFGLSRFDGFSFHNYYADDSDSLSLSNNVVLHLMEDRNSRLWVATASGLQYYDGGKDVFHTVSFGNNNPRVTDILQLHTGEILVSTNGYGLYILNEENMTLSPFDDLDKWCNWSSLNCIYEDSFHRLWIVSDRGVRCFTRTSEGGWMCLPQRMDNQNMTMIVEDMNHTVWLGRSKSLYAWEKDEKEYKTYEFGDLHSIRSIEVSSANKLYIGTYNRGLFEWDLSKVKEGVRPQVVSGDELDGAKVVSLLEDRDKNLWIGCFQDGLVMLPQALNDFGFWEFSRDNLISALFVNSKGEVLGGIEKKGLVRFNPDGNVVETCLNTYTVISIYEITPDIYLVGTYDNGLYYVDLKAGKVVSYPEFQGRRVKSIASDKDGNLYISVLGRGVYCCRFTEDRLDIIDPITDSLPKLRNLWVNCTLEGKDNKLWIGHYKGVDCWDCSARSIIPFTRDSLLSSAVCYTLLEDHRGWIWAGTNKGVFCLNPETGDVQAYDSRKGLSNMMVCSLFEDNSGNIWCSTFKGINCILVDENRIINYYSMPGAGNMEYVRGLGAYNQSTGKIYFGGNKGVTVFNPLKQVANEYDRKIKIVNFYVGNALLKGGDGSVLERNGDGTVMKIDLPWRDNSFALEVSTMDFLNANEIYFEYRLMNVDKKWTRTNPGENKITFNHLSSGNYELEIRACINGTYSPIRHIDVSIAPVWYLSGWAYLLYAIIVIGSLWVFLLVMKRKKQMEMNEEKLRFFINIAHELRSPMTLIISPLESLLKFHYDEYTTKALQSMYRNSNRILFLLNQLLDIRRIDKGQMKLKFAETDLVDFVEDICQTFEFQAEKKNIKLVFEPSVETLPVWIDRNNFDKVLINIVANAFKFTPQGGEIKIKLDVKPGTKKQDKGKSFAVISVLDTGKVIDEHQLERIFERFYQTPSSTSMGFGIGLNLARLLVQLHYGSIVAANRKDTTGSCFTITLPLGHDHLHSEELVMEATSSPLSKLDVLALPEGYPLNDGQEEKKVIRARTNYKILIVDDDEELRAFIQHELERTYKVLTASNGKEAMQVVLESKPDLVVSDVVMPEIDGFTLVKMIKNNEDTNHIPVVLLTSKTNSVDRIHGIEQGADAYLDKPFVMQELDCTIHTILINATRVRSKYMHGASKDEIKPLEMKSNDEVLMERVMKTINEHLGDSDFSVEILAEEVGFSRVQLHRKLKELTGMPASDLIRNVRLKQAANLLKDKKLNVAQVAYAVGFTNHTYFSVAFRKYYGMTPTDFVQNNINQND
ncbi:hybrid sensor histidine kinase/response regulator transcription factor [uncultured Bacteroides sp.]|uniref:hybrid sensor histidine kinase/response regulator transcription factor n=1 Tax=uncultured Bacteroides sp. TaxID=162156 RepID=UPI00261AFDEE|nr:hybrid sensor histidine kinase/response regulator transcription factor [uncultured Bacteroides sp.]